MAPAAGKTTLGAPGQSNLLARRLQPTANQTASEEKNAKKEKLLRAALSKHPLGAALEVDTSTLHTVRGAGVVNNATNASGGRAHDLSQRSDARS
jgi:hypothetical protein